MTSSPRTTGVSGRRSFTGGGVSLIWAASTRVGVRPWNGGCPASNSYAMQPKA